MRFAVWTEDDELRPWDLAADAPARWHDCAYWAEVFQALDGLLPGADLDVLLTRNVDGVPPLTGDTVVAVLFNDELGLEPLWADRVGLVAKTMGRSRRVSVRLRTHRDWANAALTTAQELAVQCRRLPHVSRVLRRRGLHRPYVLDVPLGTYLLQPLPPVPFDERPIDVGFAGSIGNSEQEATRRIASQKVRARRALLQAVEATRQTHPQLTVQTSQLLSFHWAHDHVDSYSALMAATKVALCPRGSVWESYRWWEAMASGCVVVAERQRSADYYRDAPAVVIDDWRRLPDVIGSLFADPAAIRERAAASLAFWHANGAPPVTARRVAAAIVERRLPGVTGAAGARS